MFDLTPFSKAEVSIPLPDGKSFELIAESSRAIEKHCLLELSETLARDDGEEPIQLLESQSYEYELPIGYRLKEVSRVVCPSRGKNNQHRGRLIPGNYVGRLALTVIPKSPYEDTESYELAFEVRSVKAEYRSEYRKMLEDITAECTELLMQHSSPATQQVTVDHESDSEVLYQRFAFVKSLVDSDDFRNALYRIIAMPVTQWKVNIDERDIRRARRIGANQLRQMASRNDRIAIADNHPLHSIMPTVPGRLSYSTKIDTVDTPENRFIKHALKTFEQFCGGVCNLIEEQESDKNKRPFIYSEAKTLENRFSEYLSHTIFQDVKAPVSLPLNSPILQRKEGYREVLRVWLMFDLAAKLVWKSPDAESYQAGKRDVATLYEYWLFFKLLRLIEELFNLDRKATKSLISDTKDKLGIQLKEGKHLAIDANYHHKGRDLTIQYSYNRTFSHSNFPKSGSWTQQMRPDYTLSIWPSAFSQEQAEEQELVVHIHFDAKYKVEGLEYLTDSEELDLDDEKVLQKQGKYKRADLLKMHAYKDAIRRTAGAYVLYPGSESYEKRGFHEIVPGLGAFPVSPSNNGDGLIEVSEFILGVIDHVCNRASQRERLSYHRYDIHKKSEPDKIKEAIPEYYKSSSIEPIRSFPPEEASVLIAYYKSEQKEWIDSNGFYNIRLDNKGLKKYGIDEAGVKYILLRGKGESKKASSIFEVVSKSPEIISKEDLKHKYGYPAEPSTDFYLIYAVKLVDKILFGNQCWDITQLEAYDSSRANSTRPFAVSLSQLVEVAV